MLTVTERVPDFDTYEDYLGYHSKTAMFFDIETTGLSSASAIVFLIGAVARTADGWQLSQWIAQKPEDEPSLLRAFFDAAEGCSTLIHFNGTTFDLPFLRARAARYGLADCLPGAPGAGPHTEASDTASLHAAPGAGSQTEASGAASFHAAPDAKPGPASLDLYRKFRPLQKPLGLPRMDQKTLERFLGWPRADRLTGRQMTTLFSKYAASGEPGLCELLLLHNHDDLLGMTGLLRLSACSMLLDGIFDPADVSLELPSGSRSESPCTAPSANNSESLTLRLSLQAALPVPIALSAPVRTERNTAGRRASNRSAKGTADDHKAPGDRKSTDAETNVDPKITDSEALADHVAAEPPTTDCTEPNLQYCLTASGAQAILSVPGFRGELRHFFPDYRSYYYLPVEDQAIHKSVAAFVDRAYRVPATPSNCYIKKSGLFFPLAGEDFSPAFRTEYASKTQYFSYDAQEPSFLDDPQRRASYAASILRLFA